MTTIFPVPLPSSWMSKKEARTLGPLLSGTCRPKCELGQEMREPTCHHLDRAVQVIIYDNTFPRHEVLGWFWKLAGVTGLVLQKACILGQFGVITPSEYTWVTFQKTYFSKGKL